MQNRSDQNVKHWILKRDEYLDELDESNRNAFHLRIEKALPECAGALREITYQIEQGTHKWDKRWAAIFFEMTRPERVAFGMHLDSMDPAIGPFLVGLMEAPEKHGREFLNWCNNNEPDLKNTDGRGDILRYKNELVDYELEQRKMKALQVFLQTGSVQETADQMGVSRHSIHRWLSNNPMFTQRLTETQAAKISAVVDDLITQFEMAAQVNREALQGEKLTGFQNQAVDRTFKYINRVIEMGLQMGAAAETIQRLSVYIDAYKTQK